MLPFIEFLTGYLKELLLRDVYFVGVSPSMHLVRTRRTAEASSNDSIRGASTGKANVTTKRFQV